MVEEGPGNVMTTEISNEILRRGVKKLLLIDRDLKNYNIKHDNLNEEYEAINKSIIGSAKKMGDISEDIQLVKSLIKILRRLNGRSADPVIRLKNETPAEMKKLIEKKLRQQKYLNYSRKQLEIRIKKIHVDLKELLKHLKTETKNLQNEEKYLLNFKNWVCVLSNRKLRVINEVKEMENELFLMILVSRNVQHRLIWRLKTIFDIKVMNMDRKLGFLRDTISSLQNTIEQFNHSTTLVYEMKMKIETLKNKISESKSNLEKLLLEEFYLKGRFRQVELHLKICTELQTTVHLGEKLKVADRYFNIFKNNFNNAKIALNNSKDKLFIQTLKLTIAKANITNTLIKRDELEAQIAFEMSEQ